MGGPGSGRHKEGKSITTKGIHSKTARKVVNAFNKPRKKMKLMKDSEFSFYKYLSQR